MCSLATCRTLAWLQTVVSLCKPAVMPHLHTEGLYTPGRKSSNMKTFLHFASVDTKRNAKLTQSTKVKGPLTTASVSCQPQKCVTMCVFVLGKVSVMCAAVLQGASAMHSARLA